MKNCVLVVKEGEDITVVDAHADNETVISKTATSLNRGWRYERYSVMRLVEVDS